MHQNKGKTIAQCLTERTDYAKNPDKTNESELISAYECDPHTADAEFLYSKRQYKLFTGREQNRDVIAYQIRQSFKPGEVTPEEANRISYELAQRFLKGKHAFIVCTHVDKSHIHSHIIFNSTSLDCKRKFRDFLGSGRAIARLSDIICLEHGLSIIENPKRYTHSTYDKWMGSKAKPSNRKIVRAVIDEILAKKPVDFEAFLKLLEEAGYTVKRGKQITLLHPDFKKAIRLRSLGNGYTEDDLKAVLSGDKEHQPKKRRNILAPQKNTLLIDIEAKLREGKGGGYDRWAKVHNLKQMAQTVNYLREHGLLDYDELKKKSTDATARFNNLSRANNGQWNGRRVPYGYSYDKETKEFSPHPEEVKVIKTIFNKYEQTQSVLHVSRYLNDAGLTTRAGKPWSATGVHKILTNIFLCRLVLVQRTHRRQGS